MIHKTRVSKNVGWWPRLFSIAYTYILGNPDVTHSVPTAFIDEYSGYGMDHAWVTQDNIRMVYPAPKPYFFYF